MEIINATDGYKLGHHRMYMVYSNWTPRSNRYFPEATEGSVVFGVQYFVKKYLIEEFNISMIEIVNGDLLQSNLPLIAHQTNCLGVMGADKWNSVYTQYANYCKYFKYSKELLGKCQVCIMNLLIS